MLNNNVKIQTLALKMVNGDIECENIIKNYYIQYINHVIQIKYNDNNLDKEELLNNAIKGLIIGIEYFKKNTNKCFSTVIVSYIYSYINRNIEKQCKEIEEKNYEIQGLISKIALGDIDSKNKLINHYSYRIKKNIIKSYNDINIDKEDLYQAGLLGLLNAINFYVTNKPKNYFSVYASKYIKYYINKEINLLRNDENIEYIGLNNNYEIDLWPDLINEKIDLNNALKEVSEIEKKVLFSYFYETQTFDQIGKQYNYTRQWAFAHYKKAIKKLKKRI